LSSIEPYYVIEDYLSPEQCDTLLKFFVDNEDADPRDFYGNLGLGGADRFFGEGTIKYFDFDPDHLLHKMMNFGKNFFLEKYTMRGKSFNLNRSHVNYMHAGAYLDSHNDDRRREDPIEGLNSMTYVMGLFLNDDYEGGELYFEDQNISLKPKPGTLVFFPGFYTCHGVNKVTSKTRINILSHFFDVVDENIAYTPDYAVAPLDTKSLLV
jgi:hypothetical protein